MHSIEDDRDMLVDLLTRKLEVEQTLRAKAEEHIESLEDELENYTKYLSNVKDGLICRLEASEEQAQNIIDSHSTSLQQANYAVAQLKADLESVRKMYDVEQRRLNDDLLQVHTEHDAKMNAISLDFGQTKNQRDALFAEVISLRTKLKNAATAATEAKQTIQGLREKLTTLTQTVNKTSVVLKAAKQDVLRANTRAENSNSLLSQFKEKYAEAEKIHDETQCALKVMTEKSLAADSNAAAARKRADAAVFRSQQMAERLESQTLQHQNETSRLDREMVRLRATAANAKADAEKIKHDKQTSEEKAREVSAELAKTLRRHRVAEERGVEQLADERRRQADLQGQLDQVIQERNQLIERQETTQAALRQDAAQINQLQRRIDCDFGPQLRSSQERCIALERDVEVLQMENADLVNSLGDHQSSLSESEVAVAQLRRLSASILQTARENSRQNAQDIGQLTEENRRLLKELMVHKATIENLKADRDSLRRALKERSDHCDHTTQSLLEAKAQLLQSKESLKSVLEERELALMSVCRAEKHLAEQQEAFASQLKTLELQVQQKDDALQQMRECADGHFTNLEADLSKLRRENQRLAETCAQDVVAFTKLEAVQSDLQGRTFKQVGLLEEAEQQITQLRQHLLAKETDVRRLEIETHERTQMVEARATELAELQKAVAERIGCLQCQLKSASEEAEEKRRQLEGALLANKKTLEQLSQTNALLEGFQEQVDHLNTENQTLRDQLSDRQAIHAAQLAEANAACKTAQRAHERESNSRLEAERTLLQFESSLKTSMGDFESKIVKKDKHLRHVESKLLATKHEMGQLQHRLHAAANRIVSLEANRVQLETRASDAEKRAARLDGDFSALRFATATTMAPASPQNLRGTPPRPHTVTAAAKPPAPPPAAANNTTASIPYGFHRAQSSGSLGTSPGSRIPVRRTSGGDGTATTPANAATSLYRAESAGSLGGGGGGGHRVILTSSGAAASDKLRALIMDLEKGSGELRRN